MPPSPGGFLECSDKTKLVQLYDLTRALINMNESVLLEYLLNDKNYLDAFGMLGQLCSID